MLPKRRCNRFVNGRHLVTVDMQRELVADDVRSGVCIVEHYGIHMFQRWVRPLKSA